MHSALTCQFFLDISNLQCKPCIIISADATNCFDRIAYPFSGLTYRYFGLHLHYIVVLLSTRQSIKMYVRTTFRILKEYYSATGKPFQEAIQGNAAATIL